MAGNFQHFWPNEDVPNTNTYLTNSQAAGICMPVYLKTQSESYLHPYHQYLSQFAPNFVPYYYRLLTRPIIKREEMDIENYINYEVAAQQRLMRKQNVIRRPLGQLQLQLPQKPPLINLKIKEENVTPVPVVPAAAPVSTQRRIVNATLVSVASTLSKSTNRHLPLKPLPPVEPSFRDQVTKIQKSQDNYSQLFGRLTTMLKTLNQRYETPPDAPPPAKKPRNDISTSSNESHPPAQLVKYPQRLLQQDGTAVYVLGPNGTQITAHQYGHIFWTNAPVATRCLLSAVFTSDELATHTLTGKPSPAFYGRERPAKLQLDQRKVDDIVICVRNRTGGKERDVRATITTKCADTAKKYKRRAKKAMTMNANVDFE